MLTEIALSIRSGGLIEHSNLEINFAVIYIRCVFRWLLYGINHQLRFTDIALLEVSGAM